MRIESYNLKLDFDFKNAEFTCKEIIHIKDPKRIIELDAEEMEIRRVSLEGENIPFKHEKGKLVFELYEGKEDAFVEIEYRKKAEEKAVWGFFKARYDGKYMLVTDFEPTGARTFMPCIDDPSYKASFRIEAIIERGKKVISNMPVEYVEYLADKTRYVFYPTPKMSTYLLFVGVGEFNESSIKDSSIEFIVASRFDESRHKFTLNVLRDSVLFFSKYFGINYPFRKIHWIAVPEYLAGAMENWGAITSREGILVTENSSSFDKFSSTSTIVHEVAHQWFGDLVTMKWWDDLWLNESFAEFMQYVCIREIRPNYDYEDFFIFDDVSSGMFADSILSTHAISSGIKSVEEAFEVFDQISYEKGASVLRMTENFIGKEKFRKGVSLYLKNFAHSNATRKDFWEMLSRVSGITYLDKLIETWVTKSGHPVILASRNNTEITLLQQRFTFGGNIDDVWPIPVTISQDGEVKHLLFDEREKRIRAEGKLVLLNTGRTGFYRVLYSDEMMKSIVENFCNIDPKDRSGIIDDYYAFVISGHVTKSLYLELIKEVLNEKSWLVSISVSSQMRELRSVAGERNELMEYYLDFHRRQVARLGLEGKQGEKVLDSLLRDRIMCNLSFVDKDFASELSRKIKDYENINRDIRRAVLTSFVQTEPEKAQEFAYNRLKSSSDERERSEIYFALAMSREREIIARTLDILKEKWVSRSDVLYPLIYSTSNPYARDTVWKWINENQDFLRSVYKDTHGLARIYRNVLPFCSVGNEENVKEFVMKNLENEKITSSYVLDMIEAYSKLAKTFS